jgi:mono/diheme cytochrome c family protein
MNTRTFATALVFAASLAGGAHAAPTVAGFERFGRSESADTLQAGLLLFGELGCTACHAVGENQAAHLASPPPPRLGGEVTAVGRRLQPEWIAAYLGNPHAAKPGTTMPHMLANLDEAERQATVETLTHFLAATGEFDTSGVPGGGNARADEGRRLYDRVGCQVCHGPLTGPPTLSDQRPLQDIAVRWSAAALDAFLADPLTTHPSGRMPHVPLSDEQRTHIVAALMGGLAGDVTVPDVVAFEGRSWKKLVDSLPDLDSLGEPDVVGPVRRFDIFEFAGGNDGLVIVLDGFLHVPRGGRHRFFLSSDDGSRVTVGDTLVVDYDGVHPAGERTGEVDLPAGVHPIRVEYFEAAGQESLNLEIAAPGSPRQSGLALITPSPDGTPLAAAPVEDPEQFVVDTDLARQGAVAFETHGCSSCHTDGSPAANLATSGGVGDWQKLEVASLQHLDAGCLEANPSSGVPDYSLDERQRTALAAAIGWLNSDAALTPPEPSARLDRLLTASNCLACHVRDGRGGVLPVGDPVDEDGEPILRDATRDPLFRSFVDELGDEGRLPPTLDGVGDKCRPEFLQEVLRQGGRDRQQTMATRMPAWEGGLAGEIATLLAADARTKVALPDLSAYAEATVHEQGRHLSGSRTLGCIKCHSFGGEKGQSLGVIDMTRFPQRLRHEWFLAYVEDPQRFRPGTRMPASWPMGASFYPDILDGSAAGQIESIWRYVASANPRPPIGAGSNSIELIADDKPVFYRNFIEGAGPRAIGVGFPERANIAWDAEQFRLALAWRNAFIDAGRHWTGRGSGWQPPLGDGVITPDTAAAVAVLPAIDAAWPASPPRSRGGRFLGYEVDDQGRPTFTWVCDGLTIKEAVTASETDGQPNLSRALSISGAPTGLVMFRAARGSEIEEAADGWWRVDNTWHVRLSGEGLARAAVMTVEGAVELRAAVRHRSDTPSLFLEEITWDTPQAN